MSIKSTKKITRELAISRLVDMDYLISLRLYKNIEEASGEYDYDLKNYIDSVEVGTLNQEYSNWTDTMLEDKMDQPFYRFSMFDNYWIGEDDE